MARQKSSSKEAPAAVVTPHMLELGVEVIEALGTQGYLTKRDDLTT